MIRVRIIRNSEVTNEGIFSDMEEALSWVDSESANGSFGEEFTTDIKDLTSELLAKKQSEEALAYLKDTDYLIIKELELGTPCPDEIKQLRAEARLKVIK